MTNAPTRAGCGSPGSSAASSCWPLPSRSSWRRATTRPRWTTSPSGPGSASRCSTSTSPGSCDLYLALARRQRATPSSTPCRAALAATHDNKLRVEGTIAAYFAYVERRRPAPSGWCSSPTSPANRPSGSGSTGSPRRARQAVSEVIAEDTGLSPARTRCCWPPGSPASAQVAARWWLTQAGAVPRDAAQQLVSCAGLARASRASPATGEADGRRPAARPRSTPAVTESHGGQDRRQGRPAGAGHRHRPGRPTTSSRPCAPPSSDTVGDPRAHRRSRAAGWSSRRTSSPTSSSASKRPGGRLRLS